MRLSTRARVRHHVSGEHGMTLLVVLFAVSAFSALAVSVFTDKALEAALASGMELTVSEPARNVPSPKVPWPVKITRTSLGDSVLQVRTPVPMDSASEEHVGASSQPGGWISVVQVAPGVRVCCDGGDGLCRSHPLGETTTATPDPPLDLSLSQASPIQSLVFSLVTGAEPPVPGATNPSPFYTVNVRPQPSSTTDALTQQPNGSDAPLPGGEVIACQLERSDAVLAQGLFRLQRALPPVGDGSDRVLEGTLSLDYFRPSGAQ